MRKIALIYMGGTFGCVGQPLSPMPAADFLPRLKQILNPDLNIDCMVAANIKDSSACTAKDWLTLAKQIQDLQEQQDYQHFVIIHGTDTLSYAAAVLSHMLANRAHVVVTGSQHPLLSPDGLTCRELSDALDNLHLALQAVLNHPKAVYLAFHQQVFHARSALKQHSTELNAFAGISSKEALAAGQAIPIATSTIEKAQQFNSINLMAQPVALPQLQQTLKQIMSAPPHCLILQGFGTANLAVDATILTCFEQLYDANCAIILTSQVPFGRLEQHYAINAWLEHAPVLLSRELGHADLYAKALKMYLQYDHVEQWYRHWQDE